MFGLGSFQHSKWGYDIYSYPNNLGITPANTTGLQSTQGTWSGFTQAPNGYVYALPCGDWEYDSASGTNVPLQKIAVISPGESNIGQTKWSSGTIQFVTADGSTSKPLLPQSANPNSPGTQSRFRSKGVVGPNGLIYFFGDLCYDLSTGSTRMVVLNPAAGLNCTWQVVDIPRFAGSSDTLRYTGAVLGQDGYIYPIPGCNTTIRILPRTTPSGTDTIQYGYWNGTIGKRWQAGANTENGYGYPRSTSGIITPPAGVTSPNPTNANYGSLRDAIVHPNGKIYIMGDGGQWIFYIDTTSDNWDKVYSISSATSLAVYDETEGGLFGRCLGMFMEKLKPGQDPNTLKIYLMYLGKTGVVYSGTQAKTICLDPTTDTWELVGGSINWVNNTGSFPTVMRSGIQLQNGHIVGLIGITGTDFNQLIVTGSDVDENKILDPYNPSLFLKNIINRVIGGSNSTYMDDSNKAGGGVALTGTKRGKVIFGGGWKGGQIVSVKGYYPGIKYFNYDESNDDPIYKIPTSLSSLGTSYWNYYFNKPY